MPEGPETRLKRKVLAWFKSQPDAWAVKVHGGPGQAAGTPDILACIAGRFVAIELKAPGGKPTKLQLLAIKQINDAGGLAAVCWSLDDVTTLASHARRKGAG